MQKWRSVFTAGCLIFGVSAGAATNDPQNTASHLGSKKYGVLLDLDLTGPFHTSTPWRYLVTQNPDNPDGTGDGITECFVHNGVKGCEDDEAGTLGRVYIVRPTARFRIPLLAVNYGSCEGNGNHRDTIIYAYRASSDAFDPIFKQASAPNNNEETRVVENGPLIGDPIRSIAPRRAPYRYRIEVYPVLGSRRHQIFFIYLYYI